MYQLAAEKFGKDNKKNSKQGNGWCEWLQSWKAKTFEFCSWQSLYSRCKACFFTGQTTDRILEKYLKVQSLAMFEVYLLEYPHSLHLIKLGLKKNLRPKMDCRFRDPWTEISYYKHLKLTNIADKKHRKLESGSVQKCRYYFGNKLYWCWKFPGKRRKCFLHYEWIWC